jgi:hypothetical protein
VIAVMSRVAHMSIRLLLMPLVLVQSLVRLMGRGLGRVFAPTIQQMDASPYLSSLINSLSSAMATQRGLPLLIGTGLLVLSLITHALVLMILVASDDFGRNLYWLCIPFTLMHVGVLAGFTGAMLAIPLGQGYKDK